MDVKNPVLVLKALSDETRIKILEVLLDGEKCVCEIFPKVKRTQPTVSAQLGKLKRAGLIKSERRGKKMFYKINNPVVFKMLKAIEYKKGALLKENCCMQKKGVLQ